MIVVPSTWPFWRPIDGMEPGAHTLRADPTAPPSNPTLASTAVSRHPSSGKIRPHRCM